MGFWCLREPFCPAPASVTADKDAHRSPNISYMWPLYTSRLRSKFYETKKFSRPKKEEIMDWFMRKSEKVTFSWFFWFLRPEIQKKTNCADFHRLSLWFSDKNNKLIDWIFTWFLTICKINRISKIPHIKKKEIGNNPMNWLIFNRLSL